MCDATALLFNATWPKIQSSIILFQAIPSFFNY